MSDKHDPNLYARPDPKHIGRWLYNFRCPACNAAGELSLPKELHQVNCPEQCGAIFVQWTMPVDQRVALRCINEDQAKRAIAGEIVRVQAEAAHERVAWLRREKGNRR